MAETNSPKTDGDKNSDINIWLARVKQAPTRKDVFKVLDEFRKYEWNDVQCQTMSHYYMRLIDLMPPEEMDVPPDPNATAGAAGGGNDGPVWYEKM